MRPRAPSFISSGDLDRMTSSWILSGIYREVHCAREEDVCEDLHLNPSVWTRAPTNERRDTY
ncbi:hypothetical protein CY34DRAFT_797757 [Suillus luteus UH-Slu-Lm8-n1]|uniref:Uncharacterized protein n=1 Tax=Suillus luteus UH-Slu-Lm8-n1 TaxID=930992 RepID=A0A0D0B4I2_9AGAM|nr:hypothetical protein CY34DRAFT_797757 [Suillus luteus UH-Slu-Lm8-n1]